MRGHWAALTLLLQYDNGVEDQGALELGELLKVNDSLQILDLVRLATSYLGGGLHSFYDCRAEIKSETSGLVG